MAGEPPEIELRSPRIVDEEPFLRAADASRALHGAWYQAPTTSGEFRDYVARCDRRTHAGYLIVEVASAELAGVATIANIIRGSFWSAHLGYAAFRGFSGRGLMSAGLSAVLDDAFGPLGLHRLEANVQPANARSAALVCRLGFRLEGHSPRYLQVDGDWRDHDRWAILSDEWRSGR